MRVFLVGVNYSFGNKIATKNTFNVDMVLFQSMLLPKVTAWERDYIPMCYDREDLIVSFKVDIISFSASASFIY